MTSDTKTVIIKGIPYELIKVDGIWKYLTERCHCICHKRLLYNRTNKIHGVPLWIIGHDKIGKHASLELRKKLIDAHLKSPNKHGYRHSSTTKSKEKASESMKEFHRLGYTGKDIYDLYSYINRCRKQCERQDLGFNPLNAPFTGSILHHMNDTDVMFIPISLHRAYGHYLANFKRMDKINKIAIKYANEKDAKKIKDILEQLEK